MDTPTSEALSRLIDIMNRLRSDCPWDREQTMSSLKGASLEEVCELAEAIDEQNPDHICEELGDLLLHIVFYSKIASEQNAFTLADVANGISDKLIHRHPHVFGDVGPRTTDQVLKNWDTLKTAEGKRRRSKFQKFLRRAKYSWQLLKK